VLASVVLETVPVDCVTVVPGDVVVAPTIVAGVVVATVPKHRDSPKVTTNAIYYNNIGTYRAQKYY
jgi:hypothetical protein